MTRRWSDDRLTARETAEDFAATVAEPGPRWWWTRRKARREGFRAGQQDAADWILDAMKREAQTLQEVEAWATTEPTPDPTVTNPAMIGHFAGFQKAREVVRGILGISEEAFLESLDALAGAAPPKKGEDA